MIIRPSRKTKPCAVTPCAVIFCAEGSDALSTAIAHRSQRSGLAVYLAGSSPTALPLDTSDNQQIAALFDRIASAGHQPQLVVHGGGRFTHKTALESTAAEVEKQWRELCFAGCLIGQEAIRRMLPQRQGSLLFLGHSAAQNSTKAAPAFAAASAGLRSLAQSMAREFGPQGIHVAHLMLDWANDNEPPTPSAVADTCWHLHQQHITTWTHELDLQRTSHD